MNKVYDCSELGSEDEFMVLLRRSDCYGRVYV